MIGHGTIRIHKGWLIATAALMLAMMACAAGAPPAAPQAEPLSLPEPSEQPALLVATFTPEPNAPTSTPLPQSTRTPLPTTNPVVTPRNLTPLPATPTSPPPTSITFGDSAPSANRDTSPDPDPDVSAGIPACGGFSCAAFDSCTEVFNYIQACPAEFTNLDTNDDGIPCEELCT